MPTIYIELVPNSCFLEEHALEDANFPWDDYSYYPPVILPDKRNLFIRNDIDQAFESWRDQASLSPSEIEEFINEFESAIGNITFDHGLASGNIELSEKSLDLLKSRIAAGEKFIIREN